MASVLFENDTIPVIGALSLHILTPFELLWAVGDSWADKKADFMFLRPTVIWIGGMELPMGRLHRRRDSLYQAGHTETEIAKSTLLWCGADLALLFTESHISKTGKRSGALTSGHERDIRG